MTSEMSNFGARAADLCSLTHSYNQNEIVSHAVLPGLSPIDLHLRSETSFANLSYPQGLSN